MKKNVVVGLSLVLVVLMVGVVSAQSSLAQTIDSFLAGGEGIIKFLVGDVTFISGADPGEVFFVKLLVFMLILALVSLALQRTPLFISKPGLSVFVSIVVSLLAVRFITTEALINFIWLPYGVLGVVLSSILPFIIGFYFIQSFDSTVIRRIGWVSFMVIFILLAVLRWDDLLINGPLGIGSLGWIYLIIGLISGLLIFFDPNIHAMLVEAGLSRAASHDARRQVADLTQENVEDRERIANSRDARTRRTLEEDIRDRNRRIRTLLRG
jgi:hypothetical protein